MSRRSEERNDRISQMAEEGGWFIRVAALLLFTFQAIGYLILLVIILGIFVAFVVAAASH